MSNIILIGFMGSGKTSVGIRLSYLLKQPMIDTDRLIEREQGITIAEIFNEYGEEAFRQMETACISRLLTETEQKIISTGGGLPLRAENRKILKELGTVIYFRVTAETVYERLKYDTARPLLQGENPMEKIKTLLNKRSPVYENAADIMIDVDNKGFDVILEELKESISRGRKENGNESTCY